MDDDRLLQEVIDAVESQREPPVSHHSIVEYLADEKNKIYPHLIAINAYFFFRKGAIKKAVKVINKKKLLKKKKKKKIQNVNMGIDLWWFA